MWLTSLESASYVVVFSAVHPAEFCYYFHMPMSTPEAQREYQRLWMAGRRTDWLADKSCAVCGSIEDLEVDHISRVTKVTHNVWSWSQVRRDAELAKCQVLCHTHHQEKTIRENTKNVHGHSMYVKRKCRCAECKAGHAQSMREWRNRGALV